ncbi:hypothetical protein [Chelatococcus reniformis]|uniref:Uncharacterized protein n=1 Tax=Chelatococcus reniformis TaxID=1494448 RepID=A0A916U2A6_9HYPH|nr:hypothetical protein [Chelatococcus reniformis]GGC55978.1 hypothetical protein GCM10010994_13650 [Chelatococcus reniformis]
MTRVPSFPAWLALGVFAVATPAAAQTTLSTPSWDAPAGIAPGDGAAKPSPGRAARGQATKQRNAQREPLPSPSGGSMRKIDRSEIDMSGTGTERKGPSSFQPMLRNGGVGLGTAF